MTNRAGIAGVSFVLVWVVATWTPAPAGAWDTARAPAASPWQLQPSPNAGQGNNLLLDVAAISEADAWAVGWSTVNRDVARTLIEHWNGSSWAVVRSPNVGRADSFLEAVAAVSTDDVWAVGHTVGQSSQTPLVEHWDGSRWSVVPTPSIQDAEAQLYSVVAISSDDVWAVGESRVPPEHSQPLIEHWDGSAWSIVPSPTHVGGGELLDVGAVSSDDMWAVGCSASCGYTVTDHWDGSSWTEVEPPFFSYGVLQSVTAVASDDVWAVGSYLQQPQALHWDGVAWSLSSVPRPGGESFLYGVSAVASDDVWAVGTNTHFGAHGARTIDSTLTEHWDGSAWTIVPSPSRGGESSWLYAVDALPSGTVWAVGAYLGSGHDRWRTLVITIPG